jgi:hypothetical protein
MVEMLSAQLTEKDIALEEVRRSRQAQESLPTINVTKSKSSSNMRLDCPYQISAIVRRVSGDLRSSDRQGQQNYRAQQQDFAT